MEPTPSQADAPKEPAALVGEVRGLVDALVDQLAAGQVETLYSLQSAAATVRRNSAELHEAATHAGTVAAEVAAQIREHVTTTLADATQGSLEALRASAEGMTVTAARVGPQLADTAGEAVEQLVRAADELVAVSGEHLEALERAGRALVDTFAGRMENFFLVFDEAMALQSKRDEKLDRELNARVDKLIDQTAVMVTRLGDRLGKEIDRLSARDEQQEALRAEAFVTVIEGLLARSGGRRGLRDRVRDAIVAERKATPAPVASRPAPPPPVPAAPPAAPAAPADPPVKAPAKTAAKAPVKTAPVKKAPAKPAAVKKTPAKPAAKAPAKAPAKKASATRTSK